jgi:hypothetical protein
MYLFYIKRIGAGKYSMGVAPSRGVARNYNGRGRLVLTVWAYNERIALPWLAWARQQLRSYKSGEYYRIDTKAGLTRLEAVKMHINERRLTPGLVILYLVAQGFWWAARLFAGIVYRATGDREALRAWEERVHYPLPPKAKYQPEIKHFRARPRK